MFETICQIISRQLGVEIESLTEETRIIDDLGADSLDIVEMLMAIEESCGVVVPDDVVTTFETLGDVVNYVSSAEN